MERFYCKGVTAYEYPPLEGARALLYVLSDGIVRREENGQRRGGAMKNIRLPILTFERVHSHGRQNNKSGTEMPDVPTQISKGRWLKCGLA